MPGYQGTTPGDRPVVSIPRYDRAWVCRGAVP